MPPFATWPAFAITACALAMVCLPWFRVAEPSRRADRRVATLDGLRGLLALGVFLHHAAVYRAWLVHGVWALPPSRFYALIGQVGVGFFFMITGYLFWSRLIAQRGRPDWVALYGGRLRRIAPLYLLVVAMLLAIVASRSGWRLREPSSTVLAEVGSWLTLGLLTGGPVNGYAATRELVAGVTWTLRYEWLFYFNLPWLALFARWPRGHLPFTTVGLAASLACAAAGGIPDVMSQMSAVLIALFASGMASASVQASLPSLRLPGFAASLVVGALMLALFLSTPTAYAPLPIAMMALAFHLMASGCSLLGLLTLAPARRLGAISFGVYLMQGIVLALVFSVPGVAALALRSPWHYWAVMTLCALALIGAATLAHRWVERPFMQRRAPAVAKAARKRRGPATVRAQATGR